MALVSLAPRLLHVLLLVNSCELTDALCRDCEETAQIWQNCADVEIVKE